MLVIRTRRELDEWRAVQGMRPCSLVPTMGALHDGHAALIQAARARAPVVVSIFVNPLQFGPGEDFDRYPRAEAADLDRLRGLDCAVAWLPDVATMYPTDDATRIAVAGPALGWEGERRPGHFDGVATVVARLFGQVRPETAWFGEKDWQQVQVVRRMVADLCLPVAIETVPTARAPDGLALSSRNAYLARTERGVAPTLFRVLTAAAAAIAAGIPAATALTEGTAALTGAGFAPDYVALVDGATMTRLDAPAPGARLIAAARLGTVRLLDNVPLPPRSS